MIRFTARLLWSMIFCSLCAGCASYYPISKQYRVEATKKVTYSMVKANPDAFRDTVVIWGGKIIKTTNDTAGSDLYVLQSPLDNEERPVSISRTEGRFIGVTSRFLDPELYKPGRMITIAGKVAGGKPLPIDNLTFVYPVIKIKQLHVWQPLRYYPGYYWGWGWGWGGYYDGDFDGFDQDFREDFDQANGVEEDENNESIENSEGGDQGD